LPFTRLGHYEIVRRIGRGGMGDVYLATEAALGRQVAVKVLPAELARDEGLVRRFHAEAAAVARLSHPNIVAVHFSGTDAGRPYFAMQYVQGEPLDRVLARRGRLDAGEVLSLLEQCLAGLEAAHQAGLVHRDVKPSNILLEGRTGRALVADFGLARWVGAGKGQTSAGVVLGTADYMAPEQGRGEKADARSDLYAVGVMAYQMLSGRLPFAAETLHGMLLKHASEEPTPLGEAAPDAPPGLVAVVGKLMAKAPPARYQSCAEVLADLRRCRAGKPPAALTRRAAGPPTERFRPAASAGRRGRSFWRRPWPWLAALALLLLAGGLTVALLPGTPEGAGAGGGEEAAETPALEEPGAPPPSAAAPAEEAPEPMSAVALVPRPAKLKGLRSWSLVAREPWQVRGGPALSPDGRWLALGSWGGTIRIWDNATGALTRVFLGHDGAVNSLSWSPDGKALASGSSDRTIRVWEAGSGKLLRVLGGHPGPVWHVAWAADGRLLASHGWEPDRGLGPVYVWDTATANEPTVLPNDRGGALLVAWSPRGGRLAQTSPDAIVFRDMPSGRIGGRLPLPPGLVPVSLAWSSDGRALAAAGTDGTARAWDVSTGKMLRTFGEPASPVRDVSWVPNTSCVACPAADGTVRAWDVKSGERMGSFPDGCSLRGRRLTWSADGSTVVAVGAVDAIVRVWDVRSGQQAYEVGHRFDLTQTACAPGGRVVATSWQNEVSLWRADTGGLLHRFTDGPVSIRLLAWSPDGGTLAWGSGGGTLRLWRPGDGQKTRTLAGHKSRARRLAWSPDSKVLAAVFGDRAIRLWDVETGKCLRRLEGELPANWVGALAWSPADGRVTLLSGARPELRSWDSASGKELPPRKLSLGTQRTALAWSPDGRSLALGTKGALGLWDVDPDKPGRALFPGHGTVTALAWSPGGGRLASAGDDHTLRAWDVASGQLLQTLHGHTGPVESLAWSADGKALLSGGLGGVVRAWRTEDGRPTGVLLLLARREHVVLAADGRYRGSPRVERRFVYVVRTDRGQEVVAPEEFARRYGWKNDPPSVRLLGP
jgi:WD40 repeat protein